MRLDERPRLRDRMLVVDAGQLAHDLPDRPERDAFAVRKAPAAHDPSTGADACDELGGQTRLPDARLPDNGDEPALTSPDDGLELTLEQLQLVLPPGKGRPRSAWHGPDIVHLSSR